MDSLTFIVALFIGLEVSVNIAQLIYSVYRDRRSERVLKEELAKREGVKKDLQKTVHNKLRIKDGETTITRISHESDCQCPFCNPEEGKEPKTEIYIT